MKTNIQIFTNEVFGEIRTCQVNNQIMFVGKDVATALGYAKSRNALTAHVDDEDKKDALIQGPLGGTQKKSHRARHPVTQTTCCSESDMKIISLDFVNF